MSIAFSSRVHVPDGVLVSELGGESVLLNLNAESYFGLDEVGTRMWSAVTTAASIEGGYEVLAREFEVDPERLRRDLSALLEALVAEGLLVVES